jgi:hypothetical protein
MSNYIFIKTNSDRSTVDMNGEEFAIALNQWIDTLPAEEKAVASVLHKAHLDAINSGVNSTDAMTSEWLVWFERFKNENNIVYHEKTAEL